MATREYITAMMIEFINPLAVVNLNSRLAWRVLDKYGNRIANNRPYIGFFFCDDVDPTGEKVSYLRAFSRSANEANVHLLSDSVNYFKGVINELGLKHPESHGILFPVQNSSMSIARKRIYSPTSRIFRTFLISQPCRPFPPFPPFRPCPPSRLFQAGPADA